MATHHHHLLLLLPLYSLLIIIITISLLLSPCFSSTLVLQSENQMMEVFQQWQLQHQKSYYNVEEELKRFENFKRNVKYVFDNESSRAEEYNKVGLNPFSDLSSDEFRERCLSGVKSWDKDQVMSSTLEGLVSCCDAPPYLDWRTMGVVVPVNDHGVCGSSQTFSSIRSVEENHAETKILNINGYVNVEETEKALLCATVKQPVRVGIDGSSMDFQLYTGGIYDGACSSNPNDINHEVLIVGYGSEGNNDYWIVKNSWGTNWGMDGYIYIRRNTNLPYGVCAINTLASYALQRALASSPTPSPDAPPYFPPPQPLQPPPAPSSSPPQFPPPQPLQPPPAPSSPLPQFPPPQPLQPPPAPSPPPLYPPPQPLQPPSSPSSPPPLFPPPQPLQPPPTPSSPPPHIPPPAPSSPAPQFPPPQPLQPPPAPSSPPVHPPPPPSLPPSKCAEFTYCLPGQTCCCLYESLGFCLIQGCCGHSNAVCCRGSDFCCPLEYPICDADGGVCLKKPGDNMGVALTKKKLAKLALPWSKVDERMETAAYRPLKWRRNGYAAAS